MGNTGANYLPVRASGWSLPLEARQPRNNRQEKNMVSRRSAVALAVMCALAISAVSVAGASAGPAKAFTCVRAATTGDRFGPHCLASQPGVEERYAHQSFDPKTPTVVSNEDTVAETTAAAVSVLAGTLSGVVTEIQCTSVTGTGELENKEVEKVAVVHETGILEYTGCTVLKPAGKGCVVSGGKVTTNELTAITESTETLAVKPASGTTFASVKIESCSTTALNNTFPVTGTLKATITNATRTTTEVGVTEQGTLKFGGNKAGLSGALTERGPSGNAIVLT
jgi:hypothetical protein